MRFQGLVCLFLGLLPQCTVPKEESIPAAGLQGEILNPSLYTLTAYVMPFAPYGENPPITGRWYDGKGEFIPGRGSNLTRFRYTLKPEQRYQNLQFILALGDAEATTEFLNFKDCDFAASLGYPSEDFRHMVLSYNFYTEDVQDGSVIRDGEPVAASLMAKARLERAPFGASGPDARAVRCERIPPRSGRIITIDMMTSVSNQFRVETQGRVLVPMTLARASYTTVIDQQFWFDLPADGPIAESKMDITVRSPKANHSYEASFKHCIDLVGSRDKDLIVSQHYGLYEDQQGVLRDGGDITCCLSNGTCTQVIAGLRK